MIQNADDAGAKTVWFYVDERQHGTSNLPHSDLAGFQGPALVAANDAIFTDEDWAGIQSLQQSIKADDPFKVGRFGIGFNSVYHLTGELIVISKGWFTIHTMRFCLAGVCMCFYVGTELHSCVNIFCQCCMY